MTIGDEVVRPSRKVEFGESIEARPLEPVEMALEPEAIPLDVLFEDEHLIVLDKPAGLVVHPAPSSRRNLVNALLAHCGDLAGIGGVLRPGTVHRLDRGTTGVMVAAKDDETHQGLARQFAEHTIDRPIERRAGHAACGRGRIDRPIGRHPAIGSAFRRRKGARRRSRIGESSAGSARR